MDRFEALPLPQKLLAGFLLLAAVAGGFYFLLISDAEARIAASQSKIKAAEKKAAGLKKYEDETLFEQVRQEEADLKESLSNNKAMLPDQDEIPKLISAIKRQADERGLKILMFKKEDRVPDDYVDLVPVKMEVEGSFPVVVSFFEALAQPGMRMMTVKDIEMKALSMKEILESRSAGPIRTKPGAAKDGSNEKSKGYGTSPVGMLLQKLDDFEWAVEQMRVEAHFTVYAYSYTGRLLSEEERQKRKKAKKKRKH